MIGRLQIIKVQELRKNQGKKSIIQENQELRISNVHSFFHEIIYRKTYYKVKKSTMYQT